MFLVSIFVIHMLLLIMACHANLITTTTYDVPLVVCSAASRSVPWHFLCVCEEFIYATVASLADNGVQAPLFLQEPISELMFSNESGSQISCTAHGVPPPTLSWVTAKDGSPITSVLGLRYNLPRSVGKHIYSISIQLNSIRSVFSIIWFGSLVFYLFALNC